MIWQHPQIEPIWNQDNNGWISFEIEIPYINQENTYNFLLIFSGEERSMATEVFNVWRNDNKISQRLFGSLQHIDLFMILDHDLVFIERFNNPYKLSEG